MSIHIFPKPLPAHLTEPANDPSDDDVQAWNPRNRKEQRLSEELVAKAEALYEYYLTARAVQALNVLKAAKFDLVRDPDNPELIERVREADQEAGQSQVKVGAQAYKTAEAHKNAIAARIRLEQKEENDSGPSRGLRAELAARGNEAQHNAQISALADAINNAESDSLSSAERDGKAEQVLMAVDEHQGGEARDDIAEFITDDELAELRSPRRPTKSR